MLVESCSLTRTCWTVPRLCGLNVLPQHDVGGRGTEVHRRVIPGNVAWRRVVATTHECAAVVRCQPVMHFGMMVSSRTQISQPGHIHERETLLHSDKCRILPSRGLDGWMDNNATLRTARTVMIKQDQWPHLTVRGALRWRNGLLFLLVTPEPPASYFAYHKN